MRMNHNRKSDERCPHDIMYTSTSTDGRIYLPHTQIRTCPPASSHPSGNTQRPCPCSIKGRTFVPSISRSYPHARECIHTRHPAAVHNIMPGKRVTHPTQDGGPFFPSHSEFCIKWVTNPWPHLQVPLQLLFRPKAHELVQQHRTGQVARVATELLQGLKSNRRVRRQPGGGRGSQDTFSPGKKGNTPAGERLISGQHARCWLLRFDPLYTRPPPTSPTRGGEDRLSIETDASEMPTKLVHCY